MSKHEIKAPEDDKKPNKRQKVEETTTIKISKSKIKDLKTNKVEAAKPRTRSAKKK